MNNAFLEISYVNSTKVNTFIQLSQRKTDEKTSKCNCKGEIFKSETNIKPLLFTISIIKKVVFSIVWERTFVTCVYVKFFGSVLLIIYQSEIYKD